MQRIQYSEEFKRSEVQKILLRGGKSISEICDELAIATPTFYEWKRKYANAPGMQNKERRPQDLTPSEKFKAVMDFESLAEESRGEFLRKNGLHSDNILAWKKQMEAGLEPLKKLSVEERAERNKDRDQIKELEKELRRKEKALAEAAALLILKKKADLIWGTGENE